MESSGVFFTTLKSTAAMANSNGQKAGHAPPAGFTWGDYLGALVSEAGTLTAVAWQLVARGRPPQHELARVTESGKC